ncbi:MAG: hypothetical protein ACRDWG_07105 [Actinomycetes bacterium]|nr:hypothetical protein [Actinomycetes bacterium]
MNAIPQNRNPPHQIMKSNSLARIDAVARASRAFAAPLSRLAVRDHFVLRIRELERSSLDPDSHPATVDRLRELCQLKRRTVDKHRLWTVGRPRRAQGWRGTAVDRPGLPDWTPSLGALQRGDAREGGAHAGAAPDLGNR